MFSLYDLLRKLKVFNSKIDNLRLKAQLEMLEKERNFWRQKYYNLERNKNHEDF